MRPLDRCRLAHDHQTVRDVLVQVGRPGRRTGAVMLTGHDGRLTGIFTDSDLARLFESHRDAAIDQPIWRVMSSHPTTIPHQALMGQALEIFARQKISELPVVDPCHRPCGLIDITDVIEMLPHPERRPQTSRNRSFRRPRTRRWIATEPWSSVFQNNRVTCRVLTPRREMAGDLTLTEALGMKLETRCRNIELILVDVDGVLTDGGVAFDNQGIEIKQFHVRDGLGIKLWQRAGYQIGLITSRTSHILKLRAAELGVEHLRQGFEEKLPAARQIMQQLELAPEQVCFIGDDLPDLAVMNAVSLGVAVADAAPEVVAAADYVCQLGGGKGAVREAIEMILKAKGRWDDLVQKYQS